MSNENFHPYQMNKYISKWRVVDFIEISKEYSISKQYTTFSLPAASTFGDFKRLINRRSLILADSQYNAF